MSVAYISSKAAYRAVTDSGLFQMAYDVVKRGLEYYVIFYVHDSGDADEIRKLGFGAVVDQGRCVYNPISGTPTKESQ